MRKSALKISAETEMDFHNSSDRFVKLLILLIHNFHFKR